MPSNFLHTLINYTNLRVNPQEQVVALADRKLFQAPFCYLSGHRLVEFNAQESKNLKAYLENGGFIWVDDCNHDIDGLFAKSFESQIAKIFGEDRLEKLPKDHLLYSSFFKFDGPPQTAVELNGWGDNLVHNYVRGLKVNHKTRLIYTNQDYGCEWDYHYKNKRWLAKDHTKFAVNIAMLALLS